MIRINLLKEAPSAKHRKKRINLVPVLIVAAAVVVAGGAGAALWKFRSALIPRTRTAEAPMYEVKKESAPSTYAQHHIVEDVVKEVSDANQILTKSGMLTLPYGELSFAEKINYEILFAKNIADLLGRAVPGGIGLRSLDAENFQTLYAVGLGPNKDLIQGMVTSLKADGVEILPPPYSFIKPNDGRSFKFAFSCKLEFGLNLTDPVIDAPFAPRDDVPSLLSAFEQFAKENGIAVTGKPKQISSEKVGGYYRNCFAWTGNGSYKGFVKLVMRLYQANAKFAFKRISLVAMPGSNLKIESQILLTTRE
jgi:hypothetical protein